MTGQESLLPLRERLLLIAARQVEDRVLSPGEAESLIALIDATRGVVPWICRPSDVREDEHEALGKARSELMDALRETRG